MHEPTRQLRPVKRHQLGAQVHQLLGLVISPHKRPSDAHCRRHCTNMHLKRFTRQLYWESDG